MRQQRSEARQPRDPCHFERSCEWDSPPSNRLTQVPRRRSAAVADTWPFMTVVETRRALLPGSRKSWWRCRCLVSSRQHVILAPPPKLGSDSLRRQSRWPATYGDTLSPFWPSNEQGKDRNGCANSVIGLLITLSQARRGVAPRKMGVDVLALTDLDTPGNLFWEGVAAPQSEDGDVKVSFSAVSLFNLSSARYGSKTWGTRISLLATAIKVVRLGAMVLEAQCVNLGEGLPKAAQVMPWQFSLMSSRGAIASTLSCEADALKHAPRNPKVNHSNLSV